MQLSLPGVIHRNKITFHSNTLIKNDEMSIMDSLLVIILELLYLTKPIVSHARQFHKYRYLRSITSDLLPHKILIYNDQ